MARHGDIGHRPPPGDDLDPAEPLPTEGMEVEEVRDADTLRLFVLEWRRRVRREFGDAATRCQGSRPGGVTGA